MCSRGHAPVIAKLTSLQHSHGPIDPALINDLTAGIDISDLLEPAFASHTFQEAQLCLANLARITIVPEVKNAIRKIFAAKAKSQLTERDVTSPAMRP